MPQIDLIQNIANSVDTRITDTIKSPVNTQGIVIKSAPMSQLIKVFNLSNLKSIPVIKNSFDGRIDQATNQDTPLYISEMVTPVFVNLKFMATPWNDRYHDKHGMSPEMIFNTVLCSISQTKKIVETEILGLEGAISEYIGLNPYDITINGIITGSNRHYPAAEVKTLNEIISIPDGIDVSSSFLNMFGIHRIIITDCELSQEAGRYSQQAFTIRAISDVPIELQMM